MFRGEVSVGAKDEIRREMMAERRRRWGTCVGPHVAVSGRITALAAYSGARRVACYLSTPGEVDLDELVLDCLRQGRAVWLPRFNRRAGTYDMVAVHSFQGQVVSGAFGIREPEASLPPVPSAERLAADVLWLVPGVAFDAHGNRLGRGQGYYDRLLLGAAGCRVGVAWDWQVLPDIPRAEHDVPMDWVVTDARTIACAVTRAAQAQ